MAGHAHKHVHHHQAASQSGDKSRFFENIPIFEKMGQELNIDPDFLMALSSHESGWITDENAGLHNLFGLTRAGGMNLKFSSYQECADYWVAHYKSYVQGAATMNAFIKGLRKIPYNTEDPNYDHELELQYRTILHWKAMFEKGSGTK